MPTTAARPLHLLLLLLLSFTFRPLFSTATATPQPRRILHQPLLPDDPSPPPAPSPPKYPFTTSAPDNSPFFQSYPSPPPPPAPASFASFPANISSITVPGPSKPNSSSPKLIIAAVAAVVAAITVVSLALFLHLRHRTTSRRSSSFSKSKPPNSDTSSAVSFNHAPNSRHIPKLHRPSQSSSEFLYLGTLVNSHAPAAALSGGGPTRPNYSNAANSRKLDSPELRPLPPLNTRQQNSGNNAEVISSKDDESEEFYSPKGSINGRESSIGAGSASRRAFAAVVVENFNGSSSNSSSTYSSSLPGSGSPARSASFSLSPANNQSSINTMPKSPDLIEIQTIAPLPPQVASPAEARSSMLQVAASPSPPSSSSPDRQSRRSEEISPRNSSVLDQSLESLPTINSLVLHETATDPEPPETGGLDLPACQSPSSLTSSSPESSPRNSMSDRSMESPVRTYIAVEIELHNANDIPTSPELLEYATPLALGSSPRNSDVSDQNLESPVRHNSDLQHTPPEIRGLEIPESASPLPLSSLSPERCSTKSAESSPTKSIVSDQFAESPSRSNSPVYNNSDVIPPPPEMQGFTLPESAPALLPDSDVWDWNVESPVRSSNLAQQNAAEIPTALEIQPESTLPLSPILYSTERCSMKSEESSPKNSDVSDHIESPVTIGSSVQHNATAIPTTTKNEALVSPEYGSPLASGSYSPGLCLSSEESSPRNSNTSDQNVESPAGIISPAQHNSEEFPTSPEMEALVLPESTSPLACSSSSPARYLSSEESSPRKSNVSDQNMEPPASPVPESPATSPPDSPAPNNYPGKNEDTSPRMSNASDHDAESPVMQDLVLSSPERMPMFSDEQNAASPDRISSTKQHKLPSPSPSSPSSPERFRTESDESTSKNLNDFNDPNMESPSSNGSSLHPPGPPVSVNTSPPVSVPPPPPPPPPPALSPRTPTPAAKNPMEPPALINPLRPIGFESSTLISPMQLPSQNDEDSLNPKPKLKPLHWDKVRASSDREMVWDQLKCSSFKLDEEMIETLFVVNTSNPNPNEATRWHVLPPPSLDSGDKVLDPKKSQNIAILLKALHVTVDEVCEGLLEGNAEILGTELLESLLKMAPSKEEERKLKAHEDDSPIKLGPAERFLKAVVDIPHAFKRVEALLYVSNFESEVEYLKKSFATLEAACEELRTNRMFLKLLEAVLKTGNRMNVGTNRGDAHAFKLDTLLKLVDVKGADGKTTLLHFVVQEIIRSEGARLSGEQHHVMEETSNDAKCRKLGLQVVSALSLELSSVKKAAVMDAEVLHTYVSKLSKGITNVNEILKLNEAAAPMEESSKFAESMNSFMNNAEEEIFKIQAQERLALSLVKEITEYFHGNSAMEEPHPFRIFMVVRDFLTVLDRVCKEVGMINERTIVSSAHRFPVPVNPMLQQATGAFHRRQQTSSDDESLLPFNV